MYLKAACAGSWRNRCQHEVKCAKNLLGKCLWEKIVKSLKRLWEPSNWCTSDLEWRDRHKEGTEEGCVAIVQLLSCVWLCNPMDCSTPDVPVLHYLPEFAQIHVHWVGDALQAPHPLLSPSPLVLNLSQHQGKHQGLFHESVFHIT